MSDERDWYCWQCRGSAGKCEHPKECRFCGVTPETCVSICDPCRAAEWEIVHYQRLPGPAGCIMRFRRPSTEYRRTQRPEIEVRRCASGVYSDAPDGVLMSATVAGVDYRSIAAIDRAIEELTVTRDKWAEVEKQQLRLAAAETARKDER